MFKISEIYELYCEERETLEKYEEFDREYHARKLGDKVYKFIEKYQTSDVAKLAKIPKVRKALGKNWQEQLNIGIEDFGFRDLLLHVHVDCLIKIFNIDDLLHELGHHIKSSVVEELVAANYMLRSITNIVANKLYDYRPSYCIYEAHQSSEYIDLKDFLKRVSQKSLEEVVQEYCSNW